MPEVQRADAMGAPDPKSVERAGTSAASKAAKAIPDQSHCHCRMNRRASKSETPGELNGFVSRTCFVLFLYIAELIQPAEIGFIMIGEHWRNTGNALPSDNREPNSSRKPVCVYLQDRSRKHKCH